VFIVAAVRLYQQGLAQALSSDPRLRVVGVARRPDEARDKLDRIAPRPAVVLIDVGTDDGLRAARAFRDAVPDVALVALSVGDTDEAAIACAETGFAGFVTADTSLDGLIAAVLCVAHGGARCSPRATAALIRRVRDVSASDCGPPPQARLTPRELQIVELIDQGLSNKQIARELQIELATVKNHVHSILEKLCVERRGAAAAAVRGRASLGASRSAPGLVSNQLARIGARRPVPTGVDDGHR
jgi:two-component system, NarL family, nitrate/nitrite response regulator NarL